MKRFIKTIVFCFILITSFDVFAQTGTSTEEYAILTTYQQGRKNYVNISIGSTSNNNIEVPAGSYDLTPLIAEMDKLNKMGYKLLNGSNAVIPFGVNLAGGFPVFMLVFVKHN